MYVLAKISRGDSWVTDKHVYLRVYRGLTPLPIAYRFERYTTKGELKKIKYLKKIDENLKMRAIWERVVFIEKEPL